MSGGHGKEPPPEPPKRRPEPETDEEATPEGMVEDDPSSVGDEAEMLAAARARQLQENPELHALTEAIAARVRKKD